MNELSEIFQRALERPPRATTSNTTFTNSIIRNTEKYSLDKITEIAINWAKI